MLSDVSLELVPGDLVVLYTDGVTEVRAGREEIFGHRDLAALLERCGGLDADGVAQRIQDAVLEGGGRAPARRHRGARGRSDAATMVLAHFRALDDHRRQWNDGT